MALFQTTRWSMVIAASGDSRGARAAIENLCRVYRSPVLAYVRRRGARPSEAEDLVQGFFLDFLEHRSHARADPARGRFRTFLLTALQRWLANAWDHANAQKRGGGMAMESLDDRHAERLGADDEESPERVFEREWAQALLREAMRRLEAEALAAGKGALFAALRDSLLEAPDPALYARLAERFGMRPNTLAVTVYRMRERLRELVRRELAETVAEPAEVEREMAVLHDALRRPPTLNA